MDGESTSAAEAGSQLEDVEEPGHNVDAHQAAPSEEEEDTQQALKMKVVLLSEELLSEQLCACLHPVARQGERAVGCSRASFRLCKRDWLATMVKLPPRPRCASSGMTCPTLPSTALGPSPSSSWMTSRRLPLAQTPVLQKMPMYAGCLNCTEPKGPPLSPSEQILATMQVNHEAPDLALESAATDFLLAIEPSENVQPPPPVKEPANVVTSIAEHDRIDAALSVQDSYVVGSVADAAGAVPAIQLSPSLEGEQDGVDNDNDIANVSLREYLQETRPQEEGGAAPTLQAAAQVSAVQEGPGEGKGELQTGSSVINDVELVDTKYGVHIEAAHASAGPLGGQHLIAELNSAPGLVVTEEPATDLVTSNAATVSEPQNDAPPLDRLISLTIQGEGEKHSKWLELYEPTSDARQPQTFAPCSCRSRQGSGWPGGACGGTCGAMLACRECRASAAARGWGQGRA